MSLSCGAPHPQPLQLLLLLLQPISPGPHVRASLRPHSLEDLLVHSTDLEHTAHSTRHGTAQAAWHTNYDDELWVKAALRSRGERQGHTLASASAP